MTNLRLRPGKLTGSVLIPSSKSMGHRELICAALAQEESVIGNVSLSKDIVATGNALAALGAQVTYQLQSDKRARYTIQGGYPKAQGKLLNCEESGSTLRFLIPLGTLCNKEVTFTGKGKLGSRPLTPYFNIFAKQQISYKTPQKGNLPLTLKGLLQPGAYTLPGDVSSQFISGLLFALPLLPAASVLQITGKIESQSYIAMTLAALRKYGITIEHQGYSAYKIPGQQRYVARQSKVEGDFSQIAFWLVAATLGSTITSEGMNKASLQGDKVIIELINAMGGKVVWEDSKVIAAPAATHGMVINAANCPDIIPVLTVLAAVSRGRTEIINAGRLRIKECDRLKAIATELNKLGAKIQELPEGLVIDGVDKLTGGTVDCWNDHRIAMSLAVASIKCCEPVLLQGTECVAKSYPNFWEDFALLGGRYE